MEDGAMKKQEAILLSLARTSIGEKLGICKSSRDQVASADFLKQKQGLFVTLHRKGELKGCIGTLEPIKTIEDAVVENACHAAFRDARFSPLTAQEFHEIDIEISLLSIPKKLEFSNHAELTAKLKPGVHGVILQKGAARATFLPQVWEQLPDASDFLSRLCLKAGLSPTAWKTDAIEVYTYEVKVFAENG